MVAEPKVSIVLPTYNGERFLKESIQSVLLQTYQNWELIIVNDCSTDNTLNIINEYAKKDNRIKIITNEKNLKLPASLNVGFQIAEGKYYTWTSDDNMYKPEALEKMVKYLETHKSCDLVSFNFDYINENGEFDHCAYNKTRNLLQLANYNNIGACFMYRQEIAKKVGEYDKESFCAEDYEYWIRIALSGNIDYCNEVLYLYRNNSQSLTATKKTKIKDITLKIQLKYALAIMQKCELSEKEQVKKIFEFYLKKREKQWLSLAKKIDSFLLFRLQLKEFINNIFSIKNQNNKKVLKLLWLKFTFKRNIQLQED